MLTTPRAAKLLGLPSWVHLCKLKIAAPFSTQIFNHQACLFCYLWRLTQHQIPVVTSGDLHLIFKCALCSIVWETRSLTIHSIILLFHRLPISLSKNLPFHLLVLYFIIRTLLLPLGVIYHNCGSIPFGLLPVISCITLTSQTFPHTPLCHLKPNPALTRFLNPLYYILP
jgi:hypothetical protein